MFSLVIATLRAVHVVTASFWLGGMLLNGGFVLPAVLASGPAGGQVMKQLVQVRRLPLFMNIAVVLAILSGAILFWWVSDGLSGLWLASPHGQMLLAGAVLGLAVAVLGQAVIAPTAQKLGGLSARLAMAGGPPSEAELTEMKRLQLRLLGNTRLGALLLVLAGVAMAAARYM